MQIILRSTLIVLCTVARVFCDGGKNAASVRTDGLIEALVEPDSAFGNGVNGREGRANGREGRANGLGAIADALGGGTSSGFFSSMVSGLTGMINKFSTSMGGPAVPSGMANALNGMNAAPPAVAAYKPPRMSRPGPEVFRAVDARRKKIKGIRHKRQISVKTFKRLDGMNKNLLRQDSPFGGELMQVLQAMAKMWSGMGGIGKTPVSRMRGNMDGYQAGAAALVNKVQEIPNQMFGAMRSKRNVGLERTPDAENEVQITVAELLPVVHQKNWFTYIRSHNKTVLECQELEFCKTAQSSKNLQTATAQTGGKALSYLISGLRDARGKTGNVLSQAVDCCLSDDLVQAEACENFYQQQCLEADPSYKPARD